jgi:hypothetical protein
VRLELHGTHQPQVYGDEMNLLGNNIDTIRQKKKTLTDTSKKVGLEVNAEKSDYCLITRMQVKIKT